MGKIVVGVDGSDLGSEALRWAVEEAALRGMEVHAVTAWWIPGGFGDVWTVVPGVDYEGNAQMVMDAAINAALTPEKAAHVVKHLVQGNPASAIIDLAKPDDLIVVGSHGHGGFVGSVIGSVSQRVVSHAHCPVVIVRRPKS